MWAIHQRVLARGAETVVPSTVLAGELLGEILHPAAPDELAARCLRGHHHSKVVLRLKNPT